MASSTLIERLNDDSADADATTEADATVFGRLPVVGDHWRVCASEEEYPGATCADDSIQRQTMPQRERFGQLFLDGLDSLSFMNVLL
jgi:hypothetical protein